MEVFISQVLAIPRARGILTPKLDTDVSQLLACAAIHRLCFDHEADIVSTADFSAVLAFQASEAVTTAHLWSPV
jgi:hypothetical protein